jgi:DNA-binding HxlR family transcriptional regulator
VVELPNKVRFLFGKGVIEALFYISKVGKAGYYELYKQNFVVSRQTFSIMLKTLEEEGIIGRKIVEGRPPRVEYTLTEKGKEVVELLRTLSQVI